MGAVRYVQAMPAPLAVNKEQARMLCLSLGVREAARKLGVSEDAMRQWSSRGKWLSPCRPAVTTPELVPLPPSVRPVTVVTKPADALANALSDMEIDTKLDFARAARNGAAKAVNVPVESASDALAMAKLAALVHKWDTKEGTPTVTLNLGFFSGGVE